MLPHAVENISCSLWSSVFSIDSSFEVGFSDNVVDFMIALSKAGVGRILVDLADLPVDFSVDSSEGVWVDYLPVVFSLVGRT